MSTENRADQRAGSEQPTHDRSADNGPVSPPQENDQPVAGRPAAGKGQSEELADLQDRWRRALADLDNLRKRHARELEGARVAERERISREWLPVIDTLELALRHADADPASIIEGVRAVYGQAVDVLLKLGYPRHDETGVPFDPAVHEVVSVVEDPTASPGTVVQVVRPGYGEREQLLRPAAVVVGTRQE
jgi:molecular chaperone GrpE